MIKRNPKLKKCDMTKCAGYCCYDGVYISDEEEKTLRQLIKNHPNDFSESPDFYFEDGNWENRVVGRKTKIRPFKYPDDFPKHFNQTKCIFGDDNGLCILQKIAIRENIHEWSYKPWACIMFPLTIQDGQIVPPPNRDQPDDDYINEDYPGYTNCLYCGKDCDGGQDWKKVLSREILYFKTNYSKKR
jgi:hypothetical protein